VNESNLPICWSRDNVGKAISITAKTDENQTHYFLACHSPMSYIQEEGGREKISEEEMYEAIVSSNQRDKLIVVYGEPGAGKSHLIHWLKLRFDFGEESGDQAKTKAVLIKRQSGSLKDALTQLIEQLGEAYQKYLDPVQQALAKLSNETARQMLANEMSLELGPRWADRGREEIDKKVKSLDQACREGGFREWLCRDGGVIAKTIDLLVESSDINERENSPRFTAAELMISDRYKASSKNLKQVLDLYDELDDDESVRERTAEYLNIAIRSAIVNMTGLSGANLRKVFDSIRTDLNKEGKQLALFIEDVSTVSELDAEIVNALEPQNQIAICPLIAVLGMTSDGYRKLRNNESQRLDFVYRVDGKTTVNWSEDQDELAKFVARYLNAIRLKSQEVELIAQNRRKSLSDVSISKCSSCEFNKTCHDTFGFVEISGAKIGLYPFSRETAPRFLELLRAGEQSRYSANQRGLLMELISPVMSDTQSIENMSFPNTRFLRVRVSDPYYWTEFRQSFLGSYSDGDLDRIRTLAGLWIKKTDDSSTAAAMLQGLLGPLGLPDFTKEIKEKISPEPWVNIDGKKALPIKDAKKEIERLLDALSAWSRAESFKSEEYFRDLLSGLIKNSIRWEDHIQPAQFDALAWKMVSGRKFIKIEGQSAATERICFEFARTEETRALLEALCRFDKEGGKSWNFRLGETHKRAVFHWLRKHSHSVIASLTPAVDEEQAIKTSVQVLSLVAVVRDRGKLPQRSLPELVNAIFKPKWETVPKALSKELGTLLGVLDIRHKQVSDFLRNEISIRQGRGDINFISPNALIEYTSEFNSDPLVNDLGVEYFQSFWKSRYSGLPSQSSPERERFEGLRKAIECERKAISNAVESIRNQLQSVGFSGTDLKLEFQDLCDQVMGLVETVRTAKVALPDVEFDNLVKEKTFTERKVPLANSVGKAEKVARSEDPFDVLTFDSTNLIECQKVLAVVITRVQKLDAYVLEQEDLIKKDGDPSAFAQKMFDSLRIFSELGEEDPSEAQDVEVA